MQGGLTIYSNVWAAGLPPGWSFSRIRLVIWANFFLLQRAQGHPSKEHHGSLIGCSKAGPAVNAFHASFAGDAPLPSYASRAGRAASHAASVGHMSSAMSHCGAKAPGYWADSQTLRPKGGVCWRWVGLDKKRLGKEAIFLKFDKNSLCWSNHNFPLKQCAKIILPRGPRLDLSRRQADSSRSMRKIGASAATSRPELEVICSRCGWVLKTSLDEYWAQIISLQQDALDARWADNLKIMNYAASK